MRPIRFGRLLRGLATCGLLLAPLVFSSPASAADAPADRVAAHLAAGEFGLAMDIASQVEDDASRQRLLEKIGAAEFAAGEYDAARLLVNRFSRDAKQAEPSSLAGGEQGLMALAMLIQQVTDGPWMDVDGDGGSIQPYGIANMNPAGVFVNAGGQLAMLSKTEHAGRLQSLGLTARVADLNEDMATASELRVVSLTRMERAVAERLRQGKPVPASLKNMAGLTRVQYVFLNPETNEILLAGPAEGWRIDATGRAIGVESGRPTLQLDDLVTLMRTFSPEGFNAFQCSIEPRPENVQELQEYVAARSGRPLAAGAGVSRYVDQLAERLGEQDVVLNGLPADSRVARVIVEADYRMKLIGIDKLQGAELPSFFDLVSVTAGEPVTTKALRWWLTTDYDAVLHSNDKTAFEFVGPAVKCLSENEFFNAAGERVGTGKSELANQQFASHFTKGFESLSSTDVTFADLRNVFDMALAAALIRVEGLDQRAGWDRGVFANEGSYETTRYVPIESVETAANHRIYNGSEIVVQVAGGVRGDLVSLLKDASVYQKAIRTGEAASTVMNAETPETRWWWDAASK